ncbi:hypothetical protein MD484_g2553, partial [Candolleomyces efflorescens]
MAILDTRCEDCARTFKNENALGQHRKSSAHLPRNIECPFKNLGCNSKGFISIADLARHFDANGCANLTRRQFNGFAYDLNQGHEDPNKYSIIKPDINPRKSGRMGISPSIADLLTKRAAEKYAKGEDKFYTCTYKDCGAKFDKRLKLKAHLKSPKHEALMYRCPGCKKQFPDLGSACSHIGAGLQGCNLDVEDKMKEVRKLITAVTKKKDPSAHPLPGI